MLNIFTPRARRHSASYSTLAINSPSGPRLTPRVSQLRQEECADISNSREVNHEREIREAIHMSQSWEDLTIVTENWSCKTNDSDTPVNGGCSSGYGGGGSNSGGFTTGQSSLCSSPSPTHSGLRYPYGLSPSPTRKTFATRRSMSPIAMRPSSLGPVKRKFEMDDNSSNYSPPFKKSFNDRGPSPIICQPPSPICPSPDSYEGRTTPKLFVSKLCTNSSSSSSSASVSSSHCSSPSLLQQSPMMETPIDLSDAIKSVNCLAASIKTTTTATPPPTSTATPPPLINTTNNCLKTINEEEDDNNADNSVVDGEVQKNIKMIEFGHEAVVAAVTDDDDDNNQGKTKPMNVDISSIGIGCNNNSSEVI